MVFFIIFIWNVPDYPTHTHKKPSLFRIQFCVYNLQQLKVKQQIVHEILNEFHENSN